MRKGKIKILLRGSSGQTPDESLSNKELPDESSLDKKQEGDRERFNIEMEKVAIRLSGMMAKSWKMDWLPGKEKVSGKTEKPSEVQPPFVSEDRRGVAGFSTGHQLDQKKSGGYTISQVMWSNLMPTAFTPITLNELRLPINRFAESDPATPSRQDKTIEPESPAREMLTESAELLEPDELSLVASPEDEREQEEDSQFLSPEEMIAKRFTVEMGGSGIEAPSPADGTGTGFYEAPPLQEDSGDEEDSLFLSPEEMIAKRFTVEMGGSGIEAPSPADGARSGYYEAPPLQEARGDEEDSQFLSPEEMFGIQYGEKMGPESSEHPLKEEMEETSSHDRVLDRLIKNMEELELDEPATPVERLRADMEVVEDTSSQQLLDTPVLPVVRDSAFSDPDSILTLAIEEEITGGMSLKSPGGKLVPSEIDEDQLEEESFKQLDLKPITKRGDIYSPVEILDPEELTVQEEFVSKAIPKGTLIREQYHIDKILKDNGNWNTYKVSDTKQDNKKLILKEFIAGEMDKEEYRNRRDVFRDTVRILSTFKHPNLVSVYEAFTDNYRDYYLMEVVDGLPITKLADMNTKPFSEKETLKWGYQLCEATEFMHYRPTPFTLGDIRPWHIMIDSQGKVRITGYDLQRFFDTNRTLEFMPDNPKKLYGDITKIARVLFFLLNKKEFDERAIDIEWAQEVSPKMKKLLETACKTGQKTYGDIRVFKQKLEDTQVQDNTESIARRFNFPKINIDFSWIGDMGRAVIGQRPIMLALEIIFIVFLMIFSFAQKKQVAQLNEFTAPNSPIAWLSALDELNLFDANQFDRLFKKRLARNVSVMIPATAMIKTQNSDDPKETDIILIGYEGSSMVEMLHSRNLQSLGFIRAEQNPTKMIFDEENRIVYSLHRGRGVVSVIDLNKLETTDIFLVGNNPVDMAMLPLEESVQDKRQRLLQLQQEDPEAFQRLDEKIPAASLAVSNEGSRDLMFIDTDTGRLRGSIKVDGSPSQMTICQARQKRYLLDRVQSELLVVDINLMESEKNFPLPGYGPYALVLEPREYKLWISMNASDSLTVIDPFSGESKEIRGIGSKPEHLIYDRDSRKVWVLNQGTKDVAILDTESDKLLKRLTLGKRPNAICIHGNRYIGQQNTLSAEMETDPLEALMPLVYGQLPLGNPSQE